VHQAGDQPDTTPGGSAPPQRVQLSRAKGWRMPPNTVKVDRSTRFGNPFNATQRYIAFDHLLYPAPLVPLRCEPSLDRCLDLFAAYLRARLTADPHFVDPLRGKNLACWCSEGAPCHADVLLRVANKAGVR
jgi:hypothetical protein